MVTILDTVNPKFNGLKYIYIYICMFILNLLNTL